MLHHFPFPLPLLTNKRTIWTLTLNTNSTQILRLLSCVKIKHDWRERKRCRVLTLLHTPVELSQNVIQQDVTEGLKVLSEDIADGVKCMVACGGHPLCFLRMQHNLCENFFNVSVGINNTAEVQHNSSFWIDFHQRDRRSKRL